MEIKHYVISLALILPSTLVSAQTQYADSTYNLNFTAGGQSTMHGLVLEIISLFEEDSSGYASLRNDHLQNYLSATITGGAGNNGEITIPDSVSVDAQDAFFDVLMNDESIKQLFDVVGETYNAADPAGNLFALGKHFIGDFPGVINIPVVAIGYRAFGNGAAIKNLNLAGATNLKTIGDYAFMSSIRNLDASIELKLPSSLYSIGKFAFYDCYGLKGELVIPSSVKKIGVQAFFNTRFWSVTFEPQALDMSPSGLGGGHIRRCLLGVYRYVEMHAWCSPGDSFS